MRIITELNFFSFFVGDECFAVDVTLVQKITRKTEITPVPAAPPEVAGIVNIKGKVVTVLSVPALLKRKFRAGGAFQFDGARASPTVNAVILKSQVGNGDQMGLAIDRPGDLVKLDENKITAPPVAEDGEGLLHISGVSESGGTLYRIIDADSIVSRFMDESGMALSE